MKKEIPIEQIVGLTILAILVIGCFIILRPFISAVIWAVILSFTTWPLYRRIESFIGGRRATAALIMVLMLFTVLLAPFVIAGISLSDSITGLVDEGRKLLEQGLPDPPDWVRSLPLIGSSVDSYWKSLAHNSARLLAEMKKFSDPAMAWLLSGSLTLGRGILQMALSILITFFFFRDGVSVAGKLTAMIYRIGGQRALHLLDVAGVTVRAVVYGILGTALAQGVLAAFGLWIAGIPGAFLLGLLTFFLSVIPVGPPLVWIPATIWLAADGRIGWAVFMAIWGLLVVSSVDNFIKPIIISRGSTLPFILILLGVLGGVIAFGFMGVFLGPTLLAVGYGLLEEWFEEQEEQKRRP
jgi:predicted PurR-regulated permease PerM